jgi:tetratricopeptide (TPR) repeat protein
LVEGVASELAAAVGEAERAAARARDTARLLEELEGAPDSLEFDPSLDPEESEARRFALYPGIFADHGIDVDGTSPAALADELTDRGLGAEIAMVLDMWAAARRSVKDEEGALHLLEVAHLVDPDLLRADLREAVANGDLEMLRTLAKEDDRELQPATLELLAVSLVRLGDREGALDVLARATASHPTAARLHSLLAQLLVPGAGPLQTPEASRRGRTALAHAWAAVAQRPDNAADRWALGTLLVRFKDLQQGRRVLEEAARMDVGSRYGSLALGFALSEIEGAEEEALALARASQEGPRARVMWATMLEAMVLRRRGDREGALAAQRRALESVDRRGSRFTEVLDRLQQAGDAQLAEEFIWSYTALTGLSDNTAAWFLANAQVTPPADGELSRALAEDAVSLAEAETARRPAEGSYWDTLAVARLRAGDLDGAREAAERSVALSDGGGYPIDWFVLAIVHHERGEEQLARLWFERARPFVDGSVDADISLMRARLAAEAAERLGLALEVRTAPR